MEQVTDVIGNPTSLLIERIFWLVIGGFFGLALITSIIRGLLEEQKTNTQKKLENLEKESINKDTDMT